MSQSFIIHGFAFILGAVVGSFLNVCICRLPNKESVVSPPSHCPQCGYRIRFYDNIPIISYVLLGGKCRSCQSRISLQYPIVELVTMAAFLACYWRFGLDWILLPRLLLSGSLIVLFAVDLEHQLLPNVITAPLPLSTTPLLGSLATLSELPTQVTLVGRSLSRVATSLSTVSGSATGWPFSVPLRDQGGRRPGGFLPGLAGR